jgi:hypothetical protein
MADRAALRRVFLRVLRLFPASIIPLLLYTHLFIYDRRWIILGIDDVVK